MALFLILEDFTTTVGAQVVSLRAGEVYDDANYDATQLRASGLVDTPYTPGVLDVAVAEYRAQRDGQYETPTSLLAQIIRSTAGASIVLTSSGQTVEQRLTGFGTGDVVGPASSTDNAITRFDGLTGKMIQNSLDTIDDSGNISLPGGATVDGRDVSVDGAKLDTVATGATNTPLSNVAPANVTKSSASPGVSAEASRQDHKHDVSTAVAGAVTIGAAAAEGTATTLARSDHTHSVAAPAAPSDVDRTAASAGASTAPARADHKHDVSVGTPVSTAQANAAGSASSLARSDHVHRTLVEIDSGGVLIGNRPKINFVGATVVDNAGSDRVDVTVSSGASGSFVFGSGNVSATTTTRYLSPGFDPGTSPTSPPAFRVPRAGTLRNLYLRQNTTAGNGNNIVYTLRVNGVATALAVTIASTTQQAANTTNTVAVVAGDRIDVEITKAASVGTGPSDVTAVMEFA